MNKYKYIGTSTEIYTINDFHIANGFTSIVHGGKGAFVEFDGIQILKEKLEVVATELWRIDPRNLEETDYHEYRTPDDFKVHFQVKKVNYANYLLGMWYISPAFLRDFVICGKYKYEDIETTARRTDKNLIEGRYLLK
jgi:hypothetical protein